jgi:hypothetical protein
MNRFNNGQMSLFAATSEKGADEWASFRTVSGDSVGMFRVRQPEQRSRYSVTTLKRPVRAQSLFFKRQTNS